MAHRPGEPRNIFRLFLCFSNDLSISNLFWRTPSNQESRVPSSAMYGSHPECMLWADKPILRNHRNPRLHSAFILEQNIIAIHPICAKSSPGSTSILVSYLHCRLNLLKACVCFRTCKNVSVIPVKLEEQATFTKKRLNLCMNPFILKEHVKLQKKILNLCISNVRTFCQIRVLGNLSPYHLRLFKTLLQTKPTSMIMKKPFFWI